MLDTAQESRDFFNRWSPKMAYVLGYFCADGCMFTNPRGSRYVAFYSTDYELMSKVKKILGVAQKISVRQRDQNWKKLYTLQIGSKKIYADLNKLGVGTAKAKRLRLPEIPDTYFRHFVRGYFDGDGCISYGFYKRKARKNKRTFVCLVRFASGSREFLTAFAEKISAILKLSCGAVVKNTGGFHLAYPRKSSSQLFNFMYNGVSQELFLSRKYKKFQKAMQLSGAVA